MKKNFLYVALGLMGIMGALSIGVVDASTYSVIRPNVSEDTVTVTYNANNGAFSDNSTIKSVEYTKNANDLYMASGNVQAPDRDGYMFAGWYLQQGDAASQTTEWYGIQTDTKETTKTVYAKWLPYTNKTVDLGEIGSFDIMDRNMGAEAVSDGLYNNKTANQLGYYYQWGNNYGFKNSGSVPYSVTTQIDITGKGYGPGNYYSSATFVKRTSSPYRWDTDTSSTTYTSYGNLNLWGGENTSNPDSWRQGPCPENYHVPDTLEWKAAYELFKSWANTTAGQEYCATFTDDNTTYRPKCFASKLALPFAGYRSNLDSDVYSQGTYGGYWSSSPRPSNAYSSYNLRFSSSNVYPQNYYYRANGFSVRCFKNSSTQALTFSRNGEIIDTKNVRRWEPITTSYKPANPSGTTENWYTDSELTSQFTFGNTTYVTEAKTLYSKITCNNSSYIWNGTECAPITYSVEFTGTDVSGTMANQDFEYDSGQALNANAFTKTGYIFSGWIYGNTGYANQAEVLNLTGTSGAVLTFTADWTPITYTISFSGNAADATGIAAIINAEYDSGDIAPDNTFTLTGYTFTGWNTESDGNGTGYTTGAELKNLTTTSGANVELYAQWEVNVHKLSFVVDGATIQSGNIAYGTTISVPANPTKDSCNSFAGWTSSVAGLTTTGTMPDSDVTFTANWNYTCSRSSGGGGGSSRSSSSTANTQDSSTSSQNDDKTQNSSAESSEGQDNTQVDSSVNASEGQHSEEFQKAYEFASKNGITTMDTIEKANMDKPLTRIAMAKMLSYYAINLLGMKPDETRINKFNDIPEELDKEYDSGVTLAYQLGIMGINMPNNRFRPNDEVTRAEFATALSRMLYGTPDGNPYYATHLQKLKAEGILKNDDYKMKELRGYVMIMLKRSAK